MPNRKVHVMKNLPFYCSASEKVQMLDEERRKNVVCIEVKSLMAAPDAFHQYHCWSNNKTYFQLPYMKFLPLLLFGIINFFPLSLCFIKNNGTVLFFPVLILYRMTKFKKKKNQGKQFSSVLTIKK